MQPKAAQLALELIKKAKQKGIDAKVLSGFRSIEEQEALYAQGRTAPGRIVTNARRSVHDTGLAFDLGVFKDGQYVAEGPDYKILGQLGTELGLIWGGDYKVYPEEPHFETPDAKEALQQLK